MLGLSKDHRCAGSVQIGEFAPTLLLAVDQLIVKGGVRF
jgi:hypothetical protein